MKLVKRPSPKVKFILDASRLLFLDRGFDAVSMDLIAETAKVSKATLYAHFANKEALFTAILATQGADFAEHFGAMEKFDGDAAGTLLRCARGFVRIFIEDEGLAVYRLFVSEMHKFPGIVSAFHSNGPAALQKSLASLLEQMVEQKALAIDYYSLAAGHFLALVQGSLPFDRSIGLPPPSAAEVDRQLRSAVALFVRGYAPAVPPDTGGKRVAGNTGRG